MKKTISFSSGNRDWEASFWYASSLFAEPGPRFLQETDCIRNAPREEGGFQYISVIGREKYHPGAVFSARCSFDRYGAPLLVFSNDLNRDKTGNLRYGLHFEVVSYEGGVNVWQVEPTGNPEKPTRSVPLLRESFPVEAGKEHLLQVKVLRDRLEIQLDGRKAMAEGQFPDEFYAGFTACEGLNRFYEYSAEE